MDKLFDVSGMGGLPWSPLALWQANMQLLSNMQQAWMHMLVPGASAEGGQWGGVAPLLTAFMPFMPKIEATITPLKKEGRLSGLDDASRVTMRLTLPALAGMHGQEVLLVDAVVARAGGGQALPLDNAGLLAESKERR